jgi:hypothetical protein
MVSGTSIGEAVSRLDEDSFVGRELELATFRAWLTEPTRFPEILNISGPSGVGKSTLLRAFGRIALEQGRTVIHADVGTVPATACAERNAVVLLDRFDEQGEVSNYLHSEFLPSLETNVRVVIAGRYPVGLAWSRNELWHALIRPLRLEGFSVREAEDYLHRRGLTEPKLVRQVVDAAGNNPLAISLAADLALRFGVRDFCSAPEWRLIVRLLVERLLAEVSDPRLREILEACAAVRQFDEVTLAAVSGCNDVSVAFGQLCQLSFVRPAEHGLMLHEDVRRRLVEDLAWRHPDRYHALRARALAYYRERVRTAAPPEREWLIADRFFLWGNALIQRLFFSSDDPGQVWVEAGRPADHVDVRRLFYSRMASLLTPDLVAEHFSPPAEDDDFFEAILLHPGTRLRVARERDGRTLGFSTVLPVCQETISLLELHPAYAPLVHAYCSPASVAALPESPNDATIFYLLHLVYAGAIPGAIRSALLRDLSRVFATSGIYLSSTFVPAHKRMLEACGFECVPAARNEAWGADYLVDGYVLDLSRIGFEPWIEAVMSGRRPPRPLGCAALERELQGALRHWTDDGWLARSRLADLPAVAPVDGEAQRSSAVRQTVLQTLAALRGQASARLDAAYRAVEVVYLSSRPSRKLGARNLSVSRATLYRLAKRGVHGLAEALSRPAS